MGTAIDLSQKLGLRLTPRFYYGGGGKCVAEDGKDLSAHLIFFVSCQGKYQLSPAIFRASRNHLVASKHSYMLQLSKSVLNGKSVQVNLTYDLIYSCLIIFLQTKELKKHGFFQAKKFKKHESYFS